MKMTICGMRKRDLTKIVLEVISMVVVVTTIVALPFFANGLV